MTTTLLTPNAIVSSSGTITVTGAATADAALADNSDASYIDIAAGAIITFDLSTVSLPASARVIDVKTYIRANWTSTNVGANATIQVAGYSDVATVSFGVGSTATDASFTWAASQKNFYPNPITDALQQTNTDAMRLRLTAPDAMRFYRAYVQITYALRPVVASLTQPAATTYTLTSTPPASWTTTVGSDGNAIDKYQIRVFTAAQYGIGGFDPATSPNTYDSGIVFSAATSATIGTLPNGTNYKAYVAVGTTVLGQPQWSAWTAGNQFTINVTTSDITSVVATANNANGRNAIVVTRNGTTPTWTSLEVQRSYDAGATWVYVRGYTKLLIPSAAVTATAATDLVNLTAHGLTVGTTVVFSNLSGGTGLTAGTTYFVIASGLTANAFKVSTTSGGSAVDITSDLVSGTMQYAPTVTLNDNEAPNGTAAIYRARATYQKSGTDIVGAWVTSSSATWSSTELWLKDITSPARNQVVYNVVLPEPVYARPRGVFRIIGAAYPVVVSDVLQAGESSIILETFTLADENALKLLVSGPVLLLQAPTFTGFGWGNRYIAPGDLHEMRETQEIASEWRKWELQITEVAAPADSGIN